MYFHKLLIFWLQVSESLQIMLFSPWRKKLRLTGFVFGLWFLSLVELKRGREGLKRASILRAGYMWFRRLDDVVDGDRKKEVNIPAFMAQKKKLLADLPSLAQQDIRGIDVLARYVYEGCRDFKIEILPLMIQLFTALEYDVKRIGVKTAPTRQEIKQYFDDLDIPTVAGALKIVAERGISLADMQAFIDMTRTRYNLRDFKEDGIEFLNIPDEDVRKYKIDIHVCLAAKTLQKMLEYIPFKQWFEDQLRDLEQSLAQAKALLAERNVMIQTLWTLKIAFIMPCETRLKKWKAIAAA